MTRSPPSQIWPLRGHRIWQVPATTIMPIVLAISVAATIIVGFILWATSDLDGRASEAGRRLAAHAIADVVERVRHDQESIAIWDDAVLRTRDRLGSDGPGSNIGSWMFEAYGYDRVFLLDAINRPIYAMAAGQTVDAAAHEDELRALAPLLTRMRMLTANGALEDYRAGTRHAFPSVVDVALVGGVPAIVGIVPLLSGNRTALEAGRETLHVAIAFLTEMDANRLVAEHDLPGARFTTALQSAADDRHDYYPLMTEDGRVVAFLEWLADRPGQFILSRTAPGMAIGLIIAGLAVFFLLDRLWQSAAALKEGRRQAQHQATHDALTGLANRALFETRLAEMLPLHHGRDAVVSLLMLDLDRFKQVNDTLGHQAGDDLIRAVGQRLQEIVGNRDMLARLGGDEFGIVHLGRGGEREVLLLGQRIIEAISKPFDIFGSEAFVGASIGVAVAGTGEPVERLELVRKADIALHEAKAGGRGRAVVFEEAMSDLLRGRQTIEAELREALRSGDQLSVAFQPLFSRETGRVRGAEALARWQHPRMGQVSPAHFIPVAESSGLVEALGQFVLSRVTALGARWPGVTIAVNISPNQLRNPAFPASVFSLLERSGMRPEDLELEITEGILLEEAHVIADALATFRLAGIRIALDDFGTGYSSLNYLKRYPVDRIKIDRSFVSQLETGSVGIKIVEAMVRLARALGIAITAEGVETHQQMTILGDMGCDTFQGFLLSAPVGEPALEDLFRRHRAGMPATAAA